MAASIIPRRPIWSPPRLSPWQQFRRSPAEFLARWLYEHRRKQPATHVRTLIEPPLSIVCISDTHNTCPDVPDGDILLHAGDLTDHGSFDEIQAQLDWLKSLPHRHKVVIGGNHDRLLDPEYVARFPDRIYEGEGTARADLDWGDLIYLNNSSVRLELGGGRSLVVYGSPWTEQYGTFAFQYPPIRQVWANSVPSDTDILLTHGPPKGHLDQAGKGCPQLLREIWRVRPRLVVFGHIHDGYGREDISYDDGVQAEFDGVIMGDRGLGAVALMACKLLRDWLWDALSLHRLSRTLPKGATLVNAAMSAGRAVGGPREAIVVEL